MPTAITVLYPKVEGATFNLDYYLKSHMPMVDSEMKSYGLKSWSVNKFIGTPTPGVDPAYSVEATLYFDTVDQFQEALKATAGKVLGDIPNFSNKDPIMLIGDVVGSS